MVFFFNSSSILLGIIAILIMTCFITSLIVKNTRLKKYKFASLPIFNKKLLLILLLILFLAGHFRWSFFTRHIEFQPAFTKADIVGTWEKGRLSLIFKDDGTMYRISKFENQKYNWEIATYDSTFINIKNNGTLIRAYKVITFYNELRLIEFDAQDSAGDPDNVITNMGFLKITSSTNI